MFAATADRFNVAGYKPANTLEAQVALAAKVPGLKAIEIHQTDLTDMKPKEFAKLLAKHKLACSSVNVNVWGDAKYMHGAFTHRDLKIRREALDEAKKAVRIARALNCPGVGLWLGSDGFDYPFQSDYTIQWDLLVDGIREIGEYAGRKVNVGIEYKLKEPRTHMTVGDVAKAMLICNEIGRDNVGVTVDFGHALMSRENPGESVALLARGDKLFNVHINDAFREWDDDMVPGTVHLWETVEFLYWCQRTKYKGWISLDMYPYREDSVKAAGMAIRNLNSMWKMAEKINVPALKKAQRSMDALATQEVIRKIAFSGR
ncbi:MAG: TIM barrel protein [Armatimonadetes bacterium]|nr:TIM barrel protein [Armatimonadota bacterium]NIM66841.1 TIM barrel protein [Armatimonadota bacterium]NIM75382.1 TIM barrel protein [Armatimonadota bacterium]NIN05029.1 TIM barrel protein [Armatimonadota bacterium]NIO76251.1 TIM barrel protein [Armatimonadota bacterium]